MVGGPHLDHAVVAALLEPAQQVSEIRGEVGWLSVGGVAGVPALGRVEAVQAGVDRRAEAPGLGVVGVDVVLALDRMPGELEQPADRVTEGDAPSVPDVQRAGRVDASELNLKALAAADVPRSVARRDPAHEPSEPVAGETEVDVAVVRFGGGRTLRNLDRLRNPRRDR